MRLSEFDFIDPVPPLKEPHVLAVLRPWIDVGSIGSLALSRLERHLHATEVGRLTCPGRFYDFTRYRPRSFWNQGRRELAIPNTIIRCATREEAPDLILLHLLEPQLHGEDYVDTVMEVLQYFKVKRYSLVGGMYDMVPHTRPLLVSGSAGGAQVDEENRLLQVHSSNYEGPTSITSMIPLRAAELGMETRTFVVHLPQYFQVEEDFAGTARLMETLCTLYRLPFRLIERERGQEQYANLQKMANDTSGWSALLQRLEERYDQEHRTESEPTHPLSPNIEEFLRELDEGFNRPG